MTPKPMAIVTGVTRLKGIGRAICIELAKQGKDLFFTYWRPYDQSMLWGVEEEEPDKTQRKSNGGLFAAKKWKLT